MHITQSHITPHYMNYTGGILSMKISEKMQKCSLSWVNHDTRMNNRKRVLYYEKTTFK